MVRGDSRLVLAAGVLVSAAMHLGAGVLAARFGAVPGGRLELISERHAEPPPSPPPSPPPPEREPKAEPPPPERPKVKELRLGLTDSPESDSIAWLGYTEPTPHQAPQGTTEQSAMSLNPAPVAVMDAPAGAAESMPVPPTPPAPAPVADAEPSPARAIAGMPEGEVDRPSETPTHTPVDLRPVGKALLEAGGKLAEAIGQALGRIPAAGPERSADAADPKTARAETAPPPAERPPVAKGDAATPVPPAATAQKPSQPPGTAGAQGGMPGRQADRESIAVSLKNAPTVVPGQVLAAQGLEVLTRAPRFDTLTMATQRPRNPAVRVFFGKDGKVRRAEFVVLEGEEYNTGSAAVDRQLMNSVYAWTAKGKAVDELAKGDPDAAVSIVFTILLR